MLIQGGALTAVSSRPSARVGRRGWGIALGIGVAASLAGALPAAAQTAPPDLQSTNIPSTAWAGTQLRLVKCAPELEGIPRNRISVSVESFSGSATSDVAVFGASVARIGDCARVNVVSLKDGSPASS
jgi:hypothetical protein